MNRATRIFRTLAVLGFAGLASLIAASAASAASAPSIEAVSVSHITATDATLEVQINPNGLETTYEFHLTSPACQKEWPIAGPCFAISGFPLPSATVSAQSGDQAVRLDLNSAGAKLQPDTWYEYAVTASNSAGEVTGHNPGEGPGIGRNFAGGGGEQNFKTLGGPPLIESESVSNITPTDATLEARINTDGLETTFTFYLHEEGPPCLKADPPCEVLEKAPIPLPSGKLLGSIVGQNVSADLNSAGVSVSPGVSYEYWLTATNAAGTTEGLPQRFTTPSEAVAEPLAIPNGSTDPQSSARIETLPSTSPSHPRRHWHHRRHKRGLHQSTL